MRKNIKHILLILIILSTTICIFSCKGASELEYTLSDDGSYYIVTGMGECTSKRIVIPKKHDGLPVRVIGQSAFADSDITSVEVKQGLTEIQDGAFYRCKNLRSVILSETVSYIGKHAFGLCDSDLFNVSDGNQYIGVPNNKYYALISADLDRYDESYSFEIHDKTFVIAAGAFDRIEKPWFHTLTINANVKQLPYGLLFGCEDLQQIKVHKDNPNFAANNTGLYNKDFTKLIFATGVDQNGKYVVADGVTTVGENAFYGNTDLKTVQLSDSVTTISAAAFAYCENLKRVVLTESLTRIDLCAFYECNRLTQVFYAPGFETLDSVEIAGGNDAITDEDHRYLYNESSGAMSKRYWTYSVSGEPYTSEWH